MQENFQEQAKLASEGQVLALGGRINDWLPYRDEPSPRNIEEVKGRMSVLNALINISFEAPIEVIRAWLTQHQLTVFLSADEEALLTKKNEDLAPQELTNLRWGLESLWALMWATGLAEDLNPTAWVGDYMASLLPNLEEGEDNSKIERLRTLRPVEELYQMLDFYYRLHWYCVDERLYGREAVVNEGIVYERRKALEWLLDRASDWDDIEMST